MENSEINRIFSKKLNYWLERREKSQADLYKMLGVSSATVSDWCNNKKMPKADKLVIISKWLMIELSDLLENKEPSNDKMNDILFRINDDDEFREAIIILFDSTKENFNKILDYERLLSNRAGI